MSTTTAPPSPPAAPPDPTDRLEPPPARRNTHQWIAAVAIVVVALNLLAIGLIPPAAVVLSLPFLYMLVRKPVLRRLAVRNATRRPKETLLIVLGALLGTAIITSSYVVGDTLTASIHQSAFTQLGPVDEVILGLGPQTGADVRAAVTRANLRDIDGTLPLLAIQAAVASGPPGAAAPKAEPKAQVLETDFSQARKFGGVPAATGISGPNPTGDQAAIGSDLAKTLGVAAGQPVTVYAYGASRTFRVVRVLPRLGVAGLYSFSAANGRSGSPNLFVPLGTLTALQASGSLRTAPPPLSILAVSNRGNVTAGVQLTAAVHSELDAAVHGLPTHIEDAKKNLIDAANAAGKSFTQLFQTFGYFSVAVGVLLLINIFVMLAQERKQTLGMLRAVGLRRASLVGSFSLEGWVYAVLSALAGTLVGIGIGRLVITATSRIFNSGGRNNLSLKFSASVHSLQNGFLFGFVIALLTVVLTSLYVARLNVIRAIRDLPEPPRGRRLSTLIFGSLFTLVGVLLTLIGVTGSGSAIPALIGPALLGSGLAMVTLGRIPTRPTVTIISLAIIVWAVIASGVLKQAFDKAGLPVFFIQGLILNVFAVVLVTFNQQAVGTVIRTIGGGTRNMSLRLGLAYPLAKRFRTGLLLAMYAIVVFLLVLLTTISAFFGSQINDQIRKVGGSATVIVDSNQAEPVPAVDVAKLPGVTVVAPTVAQVGQFRLGSGKFNDYTAVGFDATLIGHGTPDLHTWDKKQYPTQADAYRAALTDPTKILVGRNFGSRNFGGPPAAAPAIGARAAVRDGITGKSVDVTIVGLISESQYNNADHVFMSNGLTSQVFGTRPPNLLYVTTAPGTDNDALATTINGKYIASGADAHSFHKLINDDFAIQNQFFTLIRGYVALGLLVGIAGLGVVMIRAVRERRREVGVLRALGFSGIAVRRAFLAESSFIALEGIAVGTALALITAFQLVDSGSFGTGTKFTVPFLQLAILIVATFIASLIATAAPAIQASHIRPAVALRIAD